MYTLEDLEQARAELRRWNEKFAGYTGNNPDKFRADIKAAASKVRMIEAQLKSSGVLSLTEQELLERELDAAFPVARSKEIVEHNGRRYQRVFWPVEMSRSGKTVMEWGRGWRDITDEPNT